MRFMVIVKANKDSESGAMPEERLLKEMGNYNEALVNAGIMLAGEGLHPSSRGVRVRFDGDARTVTSGPFANVSDLVSGFWLWKVRSREEAIEWLKRAPFREGEVELRQVAETEDFAAADPTGEIRKQEEELRRRVENRS